MNDTTKQLAALIRGVRVEGDNVVVSTPDNDRARELCGELVAMRSNACALELAQTALPEAAKLAQKALAQVGAIRPGGSQGRCQGRCRGRCSGRCPGRCQGRCRGRVEAHNRMASGICA